jgi:hypothetical protein
MPWKRMGERRYSSTILDFGTRWRWVVSFTPLPLYTRGKSLRYPLDGRLGGPQSQSGRCREEKNLFPLLGIEPPAVHPVSRRYTEWAIPAVSGINTEDSLTLKLLKKKILSAWDWSYIPTVNELVQVNI